MKRLTILSKTLSAIKKTSKHIIQKSVAIMAVLKDEDSASDLISNVLDQLPAREEEASTSASKSDVLAALQTNSLPWTELAEKVNAEISNFVVENEDGSFSVNPNHDQCPFLSEVWNGDSYDMQEIEGLQALLAELKDNENAVTSENLVSITVNSF